MIPVGQPDIGLLELRYVMDAVERNELSKGYYLRRFEELLCDWTGHQYAVPVSSGTAALHLALLAHGVGTGDAVVVPSLTFAAVAAAVVHAGGRPVFVGSQPDSCMSPEAISQTCGCRLVPLKAIIAVHSYGVRADIRAIMKAAPGVPIIVDASQGHGLRSPGLTEIVSFHGNKVATTGEGGAVVTDDKRIADKCRYLACHAQGDLLRFRHGAVGYNYKMTNLQAALGCAQLERWDELLANRKQAAEWYAEELDIWPYDVPWLVSIMAESQKDLCAHLTDSGIENRAWFPLIHTMPPYRRCEYYADADDNAERLSARGINLPTFGGITREQVREVVEVVKNANSC